MHPFVVGVGTHARKHVYTILIAATGAVIDTDHFPTTVASINRALSWVARRTAADADTLWAIEGTGSYGAILTGTITAHGYPVAEVPRMEPKQRYGVGKSDALDSHRIATATLPLPLTALRRPRLNDGIRQTMQILVTARAAMTNDRTRIINALTALVRANELSLDARGKLSKAQIVEVSRWRTRNEDLAILVARA